MGAPVAAVEAVDRSPCPGTHAVIESGGVIGSIDMCCTASSARMSGLMTMAGTASVKEDGRLPAGVEMSDPTGLSASCSFTSSTAAAFWAEADSEARRRA